MNKTTRKSGYRCYHCESEETSKAGFSKYGQVKKQRFFCRGCGRYFREEPKYIEGKTKTNNFWLRKNLPSASHLILELHAIAQNVLKRTPKSTDIRELSKQKRCNSLNTYHAVFGGFGLALKRANLTPDYPRSYKPEKMIEELRSLRKRLNRPLGREDIAMHAKKGKVPSVYFLKRAFGSLAGALEAAGVGRKKYDRDEIISFLRKVDAKIKGPVKARHIEEYFAKGDGPSVKAIEEEFGGWTKARRMAGIKK